MYSGTGDTFSYVASVGWDDVQDIFKVTQCCEYDNDDDNNNNNNYNKISGPTELMRG